MIIVDASVVIDILLQTPDSQALEKRVLSGGSIAAPHLLDVEVLQGLRKHFLLKSLSEARGKVALRDFFDFPILRYPHELLTDRIWELKNNLTAYDATYVALSEELGGTLLTRDKRMAKAAKKFVKVEVL